MVVTRLALAAGVGGTPLVEPGAWAGTAIVLPRSLAERRARNVLVGGAQDEAVAADRLELSDVLRSLPVAVLEVG